METLDGKGGIGGQPILKDFWYGGIGRRETVFGSVGYQKSNIYGTIAYQVCVVSVTLGGRKRRRLAVVQASGTRLG